MKYYIKKYHGATIYEVTATDKSKATPVNYQIMAKARLPGSGNLTVDFIQKSTNREKALEKVQQDIDRYLNEHDLSHFLLIE